MCIRVERPAIVSPTTSDRHYICAASTGVCSSPQHASPLWVSCVQAASSLHFTRTQQTKWNSSKPQWTVIQLCQTALTVLWIGWNNPLIDKLGVKWCQIYTLLYPAVSLLAAAAGLHWAATPNSQFGVINPLDKLLIHSVGCENKLVIRAVFPGCL